MSENLENLLAEYEQLEQQRLDALGLILPKTTYLDARLDVKQHLAYAIEANVSYEARGTRRMVG